MEQFVDQGGLVDREQFEICRYKLAQWQFFDLKLMRCLRFVIPELGVPYILAYREYITLDRSLKFKLIALHLLVEDNDSILYDIISLFGAATVLYDKTSQQGIDRSI